MQFAKSVIHNENIILHTAGQSVSNFCYITDVLSALVLYYLRENVGKHTIYVIVLKQEVLKILQI